MDDMVVDSFDNRILFAWSGGGAISRHSDLVQDGSHERTDAQNRKESIDQSGNKHDWALFEVEGALQS